MAKALLRPRVFIPLAAVILFFFGGWTLRNKLAADRQGEWVRATRGDLVTGIDVTGTLAAVDSDSFGPPQLSNVWDFKISMMAPEGSDVKQGMPVLGFDTSELRRRLDEKSAGAEQAKKEIDKKHADLALRTADIRLQLSEAEARARKTSLKLESPPDILGIKDRKQAELDYKLARRETQSIHERLAALERAAAAELRLLESKQQQAAADVAQTEDAIRRMTILARRNGTIVYVTNWRGDKKKTGDTCWRGERVMEIPDLSRMMARGEVDEVDAGKVAIGQRVTFRLDAHPDEELHGTITTASRTVQQQQVMNNRNPLKVLKVDIALDKTDAAKMRPGMRFAGTVELERVKSALLIPRNAVFVSDEGPVAYRRGVFNVEKVKLHLGHENDKSVEVLSGLSPSDRVLLTKNGEDGTKEKS
ncbi:MAG TPA: efflux RND transporter periplasmic adaptor subunit [Thermoanaerobaculia bacterium]|jgi:multidrug efflux pump subunit AcrA (membrane-fusion protein)|nr:efflux RND transporter periplasmic adaptor subunit [Thermoanaerobaculia bacterium]